MIIIGIILLIVGGYAGYRISIHKSEKINEYSQKVNNTLLEQNTYLQQYANDWFNAARHSSQFSNEVAQNHTKNIAATMQTVILLLQSLQQDHSNTLDKQEREKISQLIHNVRSLSS